MITRFLALAVLLLSLSSCVEIIDDLTLKVDGSGTFRYTVNLSSSRTKVASILALDSLDGKRLPKQSEIDAMVDKFTRSLSEQKGISKVSIEANYVDYIFKISCDFTSVVQLQEALQTAIAEASDETLEGNYYYWLSWEDKTFKRSIPADVAKKFSETPMADADLLQLGSYTTITRFYSAVAKNTNTKAVISKSGTAVMIKSNAYELITNPAALNNNTCIK
jgi:hypothetical protein